MNKIPAFLVLLFVMLFMACDTNRIYDNFCSTGKQSWNKDTIINFLFPITDTIQAYDILLSSRNLDNYPYSNLWLFVDIIAPDKNCIRDTIEYQLAKPDGQWLGKGTSGVYLNRFIFRKNVYFPLPGDYEIRVQHGMRDTNLKGLKDIGLTIERDNL